MKGKRDISIHTHIERIIIGCTSRRKDEPCRLSGHGSLERKGRVQEAMLTTESDKDMLINLNEH